MVLATSTSLALPNLRWPVPLAWKMTLRQFGLNNSQIARSSGVSKAQLSLFSNSRRKLTQDNIFDLLYALPDGAEQYFMDRVMGRCVYSESLTMQIANLILWYMSQKDISIQDFAQEVMLPVEMIEEIFAGDFFTQRSQQEQRGIITLLSNKLIDPRTGEKFDTAEQLAQYCGLSNGEENGSSHQGQSHYNN